MKHMVTESKKNHLWRKVIWHTDPDEHPLGPHHSIEVYCCEEANGYTVWYVRRLPKDEARGLPEVENGDYLLAYFATSKRDEAIEKAVLFANSHPEPNDIVKTLDGLAKSAQKV